MQSLVFGQQNQPVQPMSHTSGRCIHLRHRRCRVVRDILFVYRSWLTFLVGPTRSLRSGRSAVWPVGVYPCPDIPRLYHPFPSGAHIFLVAGQHSKEAVVRMYHSHRSVMLIRHHSAKRAGEKRRISSRTAFRRPNGCGDRLRVSPTRARLPNPSPDSDTASRRRFARFWRTNKIKDVFAVVPSV